MSANMHTASQIASPIMTHAAGYESGSVQMTASFHDDCVPPFVDDALARLYGSTYCTINEWRLTGTMGKASTCVMSSNGDIVAVFVFRLESSQVTVCNEVVFIPRDHVRHFAAFIFARYTAVDVISFRAVESDIRHLPYPFQRVNYLEDFVVSLPGSEEVYLASLGESTRRNLKRNRKKLLKDFPSFSQQIYEREAVDEQHVRAVVSLNRSKMASKNKVSGYDETAIRNMIASAKENGFVWLATIDGEVCAGAVCNTVGKHHFMRISAYDSRYDSYGLGNMGCYLAVCACIKLGAGDVHLLWGRYRYKAQMQAVRHDLDRLLIYRSRLAQLIHARLALTVAIKGRLRQLKLWLESRQEHAFAKTMLSVAGSVRSLGRKNS